MSRIAMPSPRGTNHARLFVTGNPRAAYDEKLDPAASAELIEFLRGKLSDEDLATFCQMAGIDAGKAMDSPEPFKGMPTTGGGKFGEDSRRRTVMDSAAEGRLARRYPHAAKITVNP